jgi:hypothetical protein
MLGIYPRDESVLYDAPVQKQTVCNAGVVTNVVGADPDRVILILSNVSAFNCFLAPSGLAGAGKGYAFFTNITQPLILTWKDHGGLCNLAWDCFNNGAQGPFSVLTVSLLRNPAMYGYDAVFEKRGPVIEAQPMLPTRKQLIQAGMRKLPPAVLATLKQRCPKIMGGDG